MKRVQRMMQLYVMKHAQNTVAKCAMGKRNWHTSFDLLPVFRHIMPVEMLYIEIGSNNVPRSPKTYRDDDGDHATPCFSPRGAVVARF
jgi:hypothetical protein